jgi:hypothetical protein
LNFTTPSSTNAIEYYELYNNGVFVKNITASGQYLTSLTPSTSYNVTLIAVDVFYNKSVVSNSLSFSTTNNSWDISTGLVSYYKLDSNSNDSYGSNNGTDNSISYVSGKIGNAASFNGSSSFISIADNDDLSFTNGTNDLPFSISMWVNFSSLGDMWLLNKRLTGVNDEYQLIYYSGKFIINLFDGTFGGHFFKEYSFTPTTGTYYHIVATYSGNGSVSGLKLYVNGVSVGTTSTSGSYSRMRNGTAPVVLGKAGWFNGLNFSGKIDETAIYNIELTQAEIDLLYNAGNGITL